MVKDRNGTEVVVGNRVRVLEINPNALRDIPEDEVMMKKSMLNEVFEVVDLFDDGVAYVEKWIDHGNGRWAGQGLGLLSHEMELVDSGT